MSHKWSRTGVSPDRWTHFVDARSVVVMAMRRRGASYERIGRTIQRDHSTVIYLARTFADRCAKRPYLAAIAERVAA